MSLRLRLIAAFFALSVLPLGAVTVFTYASNVRAVKDAAAREADLLAGELTQRMQLITAQLSERVEHLMDLQEVAAEASAPAATTTLVATKTGAGPFSIATAMSDAEVDEKVAQALGEAAMLLNNVDLTGLRRSDGRQGGRSGRGGGRGDGGGRGPTPLPGGLPAAPVVPVNPQALPTNPAVGAKAPGAPPAPGAPAPRPWAGRGFSRGDGPPPPPGFDPSRGGKPPQPPQGTGGRGTSGRSGTTGTTGTTSTVTAGELRIDLGPLRQQLYRDILPSGQQLENLTPEQREAVAREVTQRMLGIRQGMQLGAAELQKRAADVQRAAAEQAKTAVATEKAAAASVPDKTAKVSLAPVQKKSALSGSHLAVRVEQDGKVLQQVNAEINLQNVLQTVFSTTRTDRGEVPFAVGADGKLYTKGDADRQYVEGLGSVLKDTGPGTSTSMVGDAIVVTTSDPSGSGLRFGIARPVGDSMNTLRKTAARNASFGLLFIGLAIVGIVPLSGRLTRNLSRLTEGVGRIAQGDYRARVSVTSHDEIGRLAGAFNQMAADVERHQHDAVGQERIRRELELGRQIQNEMLPHAPMRLGLTEVQGVSVPAREVGGDFFNYFEIGDGQVALLVGDVSGKGVGPALVMANIQASLRTRLSLGRDLSAIADAIDHDIAENSPGAVYATLFVGILDPATRRLRYVNAGHHPQYVLREKGGLERMASTGLPVGLLAGRGYREMQMQLGAGDVIFFYTDGCVEAENAAGDPFGADGLETLLASLPVASTADLLHRVESAVKSFRGDVEPFDDETMMAVRVG